MASGDKARGIHARAQQEQLEQLQGQLVKLSEENRDLQRRIDDLNAIRRQLREQLEEARRRQRDFLTDKMGKDGQKVIQPIQPLTCKTYTFKSYQAFLQVFI